MECCWQSAEMFGGEERKKVGHRISSESEEEVELTDTRAKIESTSHRRVSRHKDRRLEFDFFRNAFDINTAKYQMNINVPAERSNFLGVR